MDAQSTLLGRPQPETTAFDWIMHPGLDRFQVRATTDLGTDRHPTALARVSGDTFPLMAAPLLRRLHQQPAATPNHAWMIAVHIGDTGRALRELAALRPTFAGADPAEFTATDRMIRLLEHDCQHGALAAEVDDDAVASVQLGAPWMTNLLATEVAYAVRPRSAALRHTQPFWEERTDLMSISVGLADARHLLDRATFGQARVRADDTLRRAKHAGLPLHSARAQTIVTIADAVTGDVGPAASAADILVRLGARDGFTDIQFSGEHARLLLAARAGDWGRILDAGERLLGCLRAAPRSVAAARIALDIVEASTMAAEPATNLIGELLDAWDPHASALHEVAYLSLLAGLGGGPAGWLARNAVRAAEQHGLHFDAARLQYTFASEMTDRGNVEAQLDTLEEARHRFARAGARDWARRVEQLLTAAQATVADAALHVALTEQEARVAALAASGMTNKQIAVELFLSPRTVSGHLYRAFPKLGVTTRAGLRDALTAARLR
ncbi:helix-turn-helix transcriptional regulator [Curtobacterium flaccumfaciens]|uniref:helix-turn-helix transcriptional regulator n=1 Tax=Curtobacterium flaccumfaciens TaxID=2035 RepID=UPI003F7F7B15